MLVPRGGFPLCNLVLLSVTPLPPPFYFCVSQISLAHTRDQEQKVEDRRKDNLILCLTQRLTEACMANLYQARALDALASSIKWEGFCGVVHFTAEHL